MDIKIVALGFFKNDPLKDLFYDYLKRIEYYYKISLIEIKEYPAKKSDSIDVILQKEYQLLKPYLEENRAIYILSEHGKNETTEHFKQLLYNHINVSESITFIIGSAHGIQKDLLQKYKPFSLSKMTFPHLIARVLLIEQIYRVVTIEKNIQYHK